MMSIGPMMAILRNEKVNPTARASMLVATDSDIRT
jgi:hypothetical protein